MRFPDLRFPAPRRLLLPLFPALLFAQATPGPPPLDPARLKQLSLEELSQIEVTTVTKGARPVFATPAAIEVITSGDIRRSGARTLPDVLRLAAGVEVAQLDGVKYAVGIRGFQGRLSKSLLVLIDGRSVYTPLFAGVYWESHDTLLTDIDRIEVVRGPGATIWGANAVNGVINIITKSARDTRGLLVEAGGGNVEQGFLGWRYGAGSDRLSYRIWGKGLTRSHQLHADGRNFDDSRRGQAGFRVDWAVNRRDSLTILGDTYSAEAGLNIEVSRFFPPSIRSVEENAGLSGQNVVANWQRAYDSGATLRLQTYYDRTDRQDLNYREIRHTFDADLVHRIPAGRHTVSWGLWSRVSPSEYFRTVETVDFQPLRQTYTIASTFLEDEYALIPERLFVTGGARVQYNTFSGFEVQPTVRFAWTPSTRQTVWGAVTRAVRTPSRIEENFRFSFLAVPAAPLYIRLIGDSQFKSEKNIGYELGWRRKVGRGLLLDVASFVNQHRDLLSVESRPVAPEADPPPTRLVLPLFLRNGIEAETSGFEGTATWSPGEWARISGSYSLAVVDARRKRESNDASTVGQLEGDTPRHKVVLQTAFNLPLGLDVNLFFRHVSAVPRQRAPAYSTGDARLGWRIGRNWELSVVGRNLLQPWHIEYDENPGPAVAIRRSGYVQLTWGR
ncbi:MAG: TonB-dependent receptor [Bryobacteraceae bacterium]|nr:TonB-dependent receptor [Bryobacteraceae bacterium]